MHLGMRGHTFSSHHSPRPLALHGPLDHSFSCRSSAQGPKIGHVLFSARDVFVLASPLHAYVAQANQRHGVRVEE